MPYLEDIALDGDPAGTIIRFHSIPPILSPIPTNFATPAAYLTAMQRHSEAEYYYAILQGRREANWASDHSWRHFTAETSGDSRYFLRVHGCDFQTDPWTKHLIEVEGFKEAKLVTFCSPLAKGDQLMDYIGKLVVKGMRSLIGSSGRLRSLGYIGSYLLEHGSAKGLVDNPPIPGSPAWQLLQMVSTPSMVTSCTIRTLSTLAPLDPSYKLASDMVPVNASQEAAVRGLRPGLDVIHGPPGSGQSIME